jgi:DNA-binding NarL/FixJ family response regulator
MRYTALMDGVRVLIVDDHPLFRVGLKYALQAQGFDIVAEAGNGQEAIEMSQYYEPNVVLLDVKMPEVNGITDGIMACGKIRVLLPDIIVIMLTTFEEQAIIQAARTAGAHGFFSKETEPAELARRLTEIMKRPEYDWLPKVTLPDLTHRELQVLQLLGEGHTNKQIAKILDLSPETIKDYLHGVYRKLEVKDRLAAVNKARSLGMLRLES